MSKKNMIAALIKAGDVATKDNVAQVKRLLRTAIYAQNNVQKVYAQDVMDLGLTDMLARLKRNADALATLLSMALDAQEYMRQEIISILKAQDASDAKNLEYQKALIEKQRQQAKSSRYYQKKKSEAQAPVEQ